MRKKISFFILCITAPYPLLANPAGCNIRTGNAVLSQPDPNTLIIQTSDQAILHWDSFSIAQAETARFIMPSSQSAVLNRVVGGNLSEIHGALEANGKVFLINPKGILFGESAEINVASFFASTLDVLDADFLKGAEIAFIGDSKACIVNLGTISAWDGDIALIAYQIDNKGMLLADNGVAALAAGTNILLSPQGSQRILIRACSLEEGQGTGIDNSGTISALQTELKADGHPYQFAIKDSSHIDALAVEQRGGQIYLVAEGGHVHAAGTYAATNDRGQGGVVHLLGQEVHVADSATVDVSGTDGGGKVLVGGDYQGQNLEIANAQSVIVDKGALIRADSANQDGGQVIIWSDGITHFCGHVSAQALKSGKGGFAEISGVQGLYVDDHPNLRSAHGKSGVLLLDPGSVTIQHGANTPPVVPPNAVFNDGWIVDQLNTMSSLTISTANSTNAAAEILTVNGDVNISWSSMNDLTLVAGQSAVVTAGAVIQATGATSGNIEIDANASGLSSGNFTGLWIQTGAIIGTTTGSIMFTGTGGSVGSNQVGILVDGASIETQTGTITLIGTSGVGVSGVTDNYGISIVNSGVIQASNEGNISLTGYGIGSGANINGMKITGAGSTISSNGGQISLIGTGGGNGGGSNGIFLSAGANVTNTTGSISITGTGGGGPTGTVLNLGIYINGSSKVQTDSGSITLTGNAVSNGSQIHGIFISDAGSQILSNSGIITLEGTGHGDAGSSHGVFLSSGAIIKTMTTGPISITGTGGGGSDDKLLNVGIYINGSSIVQTETGSINLNGTGINSGSQMHGIYLSDPGSQIFSSSGNIALLGTAGGNETDNHGVFITASASINTAGNIQVTGTGGGGSTGGSGNSYGIYLNGAGTIAATNSGTISLTGSGSDNGSEKNGIVISDSGSQISSINGDISLNVAAGGNVAPCYGLWMASSAQIVSSGTGNITITENQSHPFSNGILLDTSSLIQANSNIGIQTSHLVDLENASAIKSLFNGNITISSAGLDIAGGALGGSLISTANGKISVTASTSPVTLTGGSNNNASAQITVGNAVNTITIESVGLQLTGGSADSSFAKITATGGTIIIDGLASVSGPITLTGGTGDTTDASILTTAGGSIQIGQISNVQHPTDMILQGGSGTTSAQAIIATNQGGDITSTITGNYSFTGGTAPNNGRAALYAGLVSGSGSITATGAAFNLTGGSSGSGYNKAEIGTTNGSIALTATSNLENTLQGGGGSNSAADISAPISGNISFTSGGPIALKGSTTGGTNAYAGINSSNGNVTIHANGLLSLVGGSATGSSSFIHGGPLNTSTTIQSIGLELTAGSANSSFAEIKTAGGYIKIDGVASGSGSIQLTGNTGDSSYAQIITESSGPIQIGQMNNVVHPTDMTLQAGSGTTLARAIIATDQNGNITSNISGNYTFNGGTSNGAATDDARAGIYTGLSSGSGMITMTGGAYTLQGSFGGAGIGINRAEIASGGGAINLTSNSGNVQLVGGAGSISDARILMQSTGNITLTAAGDILLTGGTGTSSSAQINNGSVDALNAVVTIKGGGALILQSGNVPGAPAVIVTGTGPINLDMPGAVNLLADQADAMIHTTAGGVASNNKIVIGNNTKPSSMTMQGGSGVFARAMVSTDQGGTISCSLQGPFSATGGTCNSLSYDARAGLYAGLTTSGNIVLNSSTLSLSGGSSGIGNNIANIAAKGSITLSTSGPSVIQGGGGSNSAAQIVGSGTGNILFTSGGDISLNGSMTPGGTNAFAAISATNGNISIFSPGLLRVQGGNQVGTYAQVIVGNPSNSIAIQSVGLELTGGSASGAYTQISSQGGNITIDGKGTESGSISLTGGSSDNTFAQIITRVTIHNSSTQAIKIGQGTNLALPTGITLQAGSGTTSSRAIIATDQGGSIISSISGDYTFNAGSSNVDGTAGLYTGLSGGSGSITLTGNSYSLTGGQVASSGNNRAEISATGGDIAITSSSGTLNLLGGAGDQSDARIITTSSGNITILKSGDFSLTGGSGASSNAEVNAQGSISSTALNASGSYLLTGGSGTSSLSRFTAINGVNLGGYNFTLTAGSSAAPGGSNAVIESTGANSSVNILAKNNVSLSGSAASGQSSLIQTTAASGLNPVAIRCQSLSLNGGSATNSSAQVTTDYGAIKIFTLGNTNMQAGSATGADAWLHAQNQGAIVLATHNLNVTGGAAGTNAGIQTQEGNIAVACTASCTYSAPTGGSNAWIQTLGSDLYLAALGSINLSGFTTYSTPNPGNLLMVAGANMTIGPNVQVIANGTSNSTLSLVVDEQYPVSPQIGPGQFILDTGAIVSAGAGTPVRIFTARRSQNTINAPINGTPFVPGPQFVNSATEQWGDYFPDPILGSPFTIFYKETNAVPPVPPPIVPKASHLAFILQRAAFLDAEGFYDWSEFDDYVFDDFFHFSTFDVCLEDSGERKAVTEWNQRLTSYDVVDDKGLSIRIRRQPFFRQPYNSKPS